MTESWLPVVGYEDRYQVSDHGQVRSVDHVDRRGWNRRGRILKQGTHKCGGRRMVRLSRDGSGQTFYVHRLVLEAFVGPCQPGLEGCHWDDDRSNNTLSNLRWDTRSANQFDAVRNGGHALAARTECKRGHRLADPNLCNYGIRNGVRACLACNKGRKHAKRRGLTHQEAADLIYADIMAGRFRQREVAA